MTRTESGIEIFRRDGTAAVAIASPAVAQHSPQIDFKSVGRGAPVMVDARELPVIGATYQGGPGGGNQGNPATPRTFVGSAAPGETPKGIEPLPRDMFTSDDFYKDRELWSDPRYFRCNSTRRSRTCYQRGAIAKRPKSAGCDFATATSARGDREPVSFRTRKTLESLKVETTNAGGPTQHT